MAPQEHSYRQVPKVPQHTYYQTPFRAAAESYEAAGTGKDSDNQPILSNLIRRSRSLTDADLTNELQPSDRRRSFFSRRRSKLTTDQPELSATTPGRSFSGLLPSQASAGDSDIKSPMCKSEPKALKLRADADADTSSTKSKSSRWWSWGSSSKALKPDAKAPLTADTRSTAVKEAGSRSRPSSLEVDPPGQSAGSNIAPSSAQLAQTSPLVQSGCMSMFSAAPAQPEKPISDVQWADSDLGNSRDNNAMNNSYTSAASSQAATHPYIPNGLLQEAGSSPGSEQSKVNRQVGHSRHVSWDDTYPDLSSSGGLVDSGNHQELSQPPFTSAFMADYESMDGSLADNRAVPDSSSPISSPFSDTAHPGSPPLQPGLSHLSSSPSAQARTLPGVSSAGGASSLPASAAAAVHANGTSGKVPSEAENALPAQPAEAEKQKKGHRRGRSLTGLIPTLKTKPKRSQSQHLEVEPTTPAASSSQAGRPKTPETKAAGPNSSSLGQCFGMGKTLEDAEKEELPLGVVGLRNLGNTCFVNVALQCLRYTPKLPQAIYPDLVRFSLIEQEPVAMPVSVESTTESAPSFDPMHSGSDLPSVPEASALADVATQISTPSASLNSQPDGFATSNSNLNATDLQQSMHSTGQARSNLNTAEPQQSMHSTSGPDQHQLSQDQQAQMQASQPIGVPASHAGLTSHSRVSHQEQLHASSPQSLAGSRLSSLASSDSVNASPRTVTEASPVGIADNPGAGTLLSNPASQQQQQMQQQQSYAESAQPGADPTHGDDSDKAPPNESIPAKQPPPVAAPQVPLKKGDIAESFRTLVKQVYAKGNHYAVDPAHFLRRIAQLPMGAEFCDGGQHDAQELFRLLLDSLHDDLNRITKKAAYEEDKDVSGEAEPDKAERLWRKYLCMDNSPITDLFGGQLQSTVHCHKCKGNFTTYEPFWDLSLPIVREGKGGLGAWLSGKSIPTTIQDCLQAFTADEVLQGDESFKCEACNEKTEATKRLRLYRLPQVLLLHIKRFKYSGSSREKLTNNVTFPIKGLKLNQFVSSVSSPSDLNANYDLYAVSNHYGSMAGGHYTAACRVGLSGGKEQWFNFNDDAVSKLSPQSVVTSCAYMLFYVRTE